ncbi:S9 family peptidase [Chitinophaga oryzae]|uniref:S9 family peptidase n=1 Tax=Chitinophaga oryzae TaxID=2725414 RepID=A0ABX6LG17_9BACT|nr:prolyl oligopeptidase family serine peptidase [Chitinophaga oryzae]QJB39079.1 S9 family peptidase [Chitinophaga oryzae]
MNRSYAQKKPLGLDDYASWVTVGGAVISGDGKFVSYAVVNKPKEGAMTIVLKSLDTLFQMEFENVSPGNCTFSPNNRYFLCMEPGKNLSIVSLDSYNVEIIPGVQGFKVVKGKNSSLLVYQNVNADVKQLSVRELENGRRLSYSNVYDYWMSDVGGFIVLKRKTDSATYTLTECNLNDFKEHEIYRGAEPINPVWDSDGNQLVFCVNMNGGENSVATSLWYFNRKRTTQAVRKYPKMKVNSGYYLKNLSIFSGEGNFVYCRLVKKKEEKKMNEVSIMTYLDSNLKSTDSDLKEPMLAVWNLRKDSLLQIQVEGDMPIYPRLERTKQLVFSASAYKGEWNWNEKAILNCSLVNIEDGTKINLTGSGDRNGESYTLSPSGKWVVYFDADLGCYFSINTITGIKRNITKNISTTWTTYDRDDLPVARYLNIGLGGFSKDERFVYLYSQYDIYVVDLTANRSPVNLTDQYGVKNNIVFRFAFPPDKWNGKEIILTAFNRLTKEDGFFKVEENVPNSLQKLVMQQAVFSGPEESKYFLRSMPIKAEGANRFVVQKMTATTSSNLFSTKDFVSFEQLSSECPEEKFNWLTSELITFKTLDGKNTQGILYKPQDFDSSRKYPVIIYSYEKITECLNMYLTPDLCAGPLNIPYFVSNGFLVFTPDIHFVVGQPGRSAFNTIVAAANLLGKLDFVDSSKIGLQGHSFGGFHTNYIITHTKQFAAACSAAGFTNFVSAYGSIIGDGYSRQGQYELYRDRIGKSLWEGVDLYLENSPVLRLDKISTPLLMMHNAEDSDVPVSQGIEFFTGLRRLGKVVYLLQYKGEGHSVFGVAARDYSQRMMDFFSYYLKGEKLPHWMISQPAKIINFNPYHFNR